MSIDQSSHFTSEFPDFQDDSLSCTNCHTNRHLTVESIQAADSQSAGAVSVEYSCGGCEAFFAHEARVESVAKLLLASNSGSNILQFGRHYIHCGEPMSRGRLQLAGEDLLDAPGMKAPIKVLRCGCGFQMTVPSL